jgi:hypothetical protein
MLRIRTTLFHRTYAISTLCWLLIVWGLSGGCARLPYTTQAVHEDRRVVVALQQEIKPAAYSHPVRLSSEEITSILAAFSFREKQRLPLRWFAEESPPRQLFRSDELLALVPFLAEGLQKAGPEERVHFEVLAPGMNPASERDTTAGWVAVRDPYFHLRLEHFHAQFPVRKSEPMDVRYPAIPPESGTYLLYFEPGRFWVTDPVSGDHVVQFREFLKSAIPQPKK